MRRRALDKQIQLENKIKELDNILVKMVQSIQTMHILLPKPNSFYHTEQKMALGYQNPFYLKQAPQKQQSLYNGKVILEKHDPPTVYDSKETLQHAQEPKFVRDFKSLAKEADESLAKHKALELEIERLLRAVVSQDIMSIMQNNTAKTRRLRPMSNIKNDRVPSASMSSCIKNKEIKVEEHLRNLLLSKNKKDLSSECNNIKLAIQNDKSEIVCAMCYLNLFMKFLGTDHFGNDHVTAIMGFDDLQWGNILITRVYFVEGLGNNLFSVGQFYDSDLEVAFRRNTCFVINLKGVDLLKGNRTTNLYTINLHDMVSASPICLMPRATSTKSWL
nr:integrase, catalytic region, zinc finger, CCHC-type, peptidase aspartic, catalytic [Tanacetum cinerariifolium]